MSRLLWTSLERVNIAIFTPDVAADITSETTLFLAPFIFPFVLSVWWNLYVELRIMEIGLLINQWKRWVQTHPVKFKSCHFS